MANRHSSIIIDLQEFRQRLCNRYESLGAITFTDFGTLGTRETREVT